MIVSKVTAILVKPLATGAAWCYGPQGKHIGGINVTREGRRTCFELGGQTDGAAS